MQFETAWDYQLIYKCMDNEKDLLKKDLGTLENREDIEKFAEDAEIMGHPDIVNLAKEKLASLQAVAQNIETVTQVQVASVENLGGSEEVLAEKTQEVDAKIEVVKVEATEKIKAVEKPKRSEVDWENFKKQYGEMRNPEVDQLGAILDISRMRSDGFGDKVKLSEDQVSQLAESVLDRFSPGSPEYDSVHYLSYLQRISVKGGIKVDLEKVKKNIITINEYEPSLTKDVMEKYGIKDVSQNTNNESTNFLSESLEPAVDEKTKAYYNAPDAQQRALKSIDIYHFGSIQGSPSVYEYLLYKGLITEDQLAEKIQNMINDFIAREKKNATSPSIIKEDINANLEDFKNGFKNNNYIDNIMSKLKINL